jgi:hypothetical protein
MADSISRMYMNFNLAIRITPLQHPPLYSAISHKASTFSLKFQYRTVIMAVTASPSPVPATSERMKRSSRLLGVRDFANASPRVKSISSQSSVSNADKVTVCVRYVLALVQYLELFAKLILC